MMLRTLCAVITKLLIFSLSWVCRVLVKMVLYSAEVLRLLSSLAPHFLQFSKAIEVKRADADAADQRGKTDDDRSLAVAGRKWQSVRRMEVKVGLP